MFGKISERPPSGRPHIVGVRELSAEELVDVKRGASAPVKKLRDSHHMVARLFASGLAPGEVARETGYSLGRISILSSDPSFQELVSHYRGMVDLAFVGSQDEYFSTISANRRMAARLINDKLCDTNPEDIAFRDLIAIHADAADRTGYPKRTVALNVNADFAALLDKAIQRSQSAEGAAPHTDLDLIAVSSQPALDPPSKAATEGEVCLPPPLLRRRA